MKRKILLLPLAEEDINQYIVYLAEKAGPDIAVRFNESLLSSFKLLRERPFLGKERLYLSPVLEGIRIWFVKGFENCLIFYKISDGRYTSFVFCTPHVTRKA
jgi:toxin ParE1/3/4